MPACKLVSVTDQRAQLYFIGHSRGWLVVGSNPKTLAASTPRGSATFQFRGGAVMAQGDQRAVAHAGSSSASGLSPAGLSQYSTRFKPDMPTITVPLTGS